MSDTFKIDEPSRRLYHKSIEIEMN